MNKPEYVGLLIAEYEKRKESNPRYSERAFASSLGLSPGYLKLLFQGKKSLSVQRASELNLKLNWRDSQKKKFIEFVKNEQARKTPQTRGKKVLKNEEFFEIADWFNFAIVEFIKIKNNSPTLSQISKGFNLPTVMINYALDNLIRLGLLERVGNQGFKVADRYEMPSMSSESIRKFHEQILGLAIKSLESQTFEQRDLRSLTLAFDKDRMDEAKKDLEKFTAQFDKKYGSGKGNSVYQLNTSFFRLDKETV